MSHIHTVGKPVEWAGLNAYLDRQETSTSTKKPKTLVVFGPLLDSPPAHPDTVLTTLVYLEKTLKTFGMQYAHLSVDLQPVPDLRRAGPVANWWAWAPTN